MPLSPGERLTLTITDIGFGGEGVARMDDFVVFVPFVAPGEEIEAEAIEVKKRFARARLIRVIQPSEDRVTPQCVYFGQCGGCQYQHLSYDTQLRIKHKQIRDIFNRIGGFDPALIAPVVPCPQPYGYRNRVMIRSQWNKFKQGLEIGFIRADSRLVVDIEECKIAEPAINQQIAHVRANPPPKGGLKVMLRIPPEDWDVPPDSFFQNNFFLLPSLVSVVRDRLRLAATRHLLDLYCGVGFFAIELAGEIESFAGVEYDQQAVKSARRNAERRGVKNGEFISGPAEETLPDLMGRFRDKATTVILDPPRKGCRPETLELLRRAQPAQIIYVGCDPATMARDLNALCADAVYSLTQVIPLDMFPQTYHVESVADLRKL